MNHRAGFINGEGRWSWYSYQIFQSSFGRKNYVMQDLDEELVDQEEFAVGHMFISRKANWNL